MSSAPADVMVVTALSTEAANIKNFRNWLSRQVCRMPDAGQGRRCVVLGIERRAGNTRISHHRLRVVSANLASVQAGTS
jgi:hypothetical protein